MVTRPYLFLSVIAFLSLGFINEASAQEGKQEYQQAIDLFEAEEPEAALPFFKKAYELSGRRPSTILGLAQCERALKRYEPAIVHFEEFLATNPEKAQAERVKETLRLTRLIVDSQQAIMRPPDPPLTASKEDMQATAVVEEEPSTWSKPWVWIAIGTVVVAGIAGAGLALSQEESEPYRGNTNIVLQPLIKW